MRLKRSDNQYVEVEEFSDYELTQCIAYEMVIRDRHYKRVADEVVVYYKDNQKSIDYYLFNDNQYADNIDLLQLEKGSKNFKELMSRVHEISHILYMVYEYIMPISEQYQDTRLGVEFWEVINILSQDLKPNEEKLEQGKGVLVHQKDMGEIQLIKKINRKGYSMDIVLSSCDEESSMEDGSEIRTIDNYAKFIEEEDSLGRSRITIEENFKRPLVRVDEHKTINPEITLNLNRPLNELIACITHIKKDIDKHNLIQLPIELLGTELKRGDNLVCNEKGEKCFDPRGILSKQQKMADMFYIYDCIKEGYSQTKIRNEVYNYYADKGLNISLDPATLRKYRDIAKEYIENKKYKEMITGISIDDLTNM